jgi:hypothetical protein
VNGKFYTRIQLMSIRASQGAERKETEPVGEDLITILFNRSSLHFSFHAMLDSCLLAITATNTR